MNEYTLPNQNLRDEERKALRIALSIVMFGVLTAIFSGVLWWLK